MDASVFDKIFSAAAGVWALVCMAGVALFRAWPHILGRLNERQRDLNTEKAGDWERIRSERDVAREERDLVRDKWAEEQAEKFMWMGRAIKAERAYEGLLEGIGEARQEAQRIVSAEREKDAKRSGNGGGE